MPIDFLAALEGGFAPPKKSASTKQPPKKRLRRDEEEEDEDEDEEDQEGEDVEGREQRMEQIPEVIKEMGKEFGWSLEELEVGQKAFLWMIGEEAWNRRDLYESISRAILLRRSTILEKKIQELHNDVKGLEVKVAKSLAPNAKAAKVLSKDETASLKKLVFRTFFCGVVSQWDADSKQIQEVIWKVLSTSDYQGLKELVGTTRWEFYKGTDGKAQIVKLIREEVERLRSGVQIKIGESSGEKSSQILNVIQLSNKLIGNRGIVLTVEMCYRVAFFRYALKVLKGRIKQTKEDDDVFEGDEGEAAESTVYKNDLKFWPNIKKLIVTLRDKAVAEHPIDKAGQETYLKAFFRNVYEKDLVEYPCEVEEGDAVNEDHDMSVTGHAARALSDEKEKEKSGSRGVGEGN